MSAFVGVPDYGPEIVPAARVLGPDGRRGTVVCINEGCHWNCEDSAKQWRPRSAYVEWDDRGAGAGYAPPEDLSRIPATWGPGVGIVAGPETRGRVRPFCPTVVRLLVFRESTISAQWHLMNRKAKGWGESSTYYTSWRALLADWDIERGEPEADESGWLVPVWPSARREEQPA